MGLFLLPDWVELHFIQGQIGLIAREIIGKSEVPHDARCEDIAGLVIFFGL